MKKTLIASLLCLLFFGFIEQSNGQNTANLQKSRIQKQVDDIFQTMVKAAESLDYDKINTGVDDRYHAGFIVNGTYFTNYDSLINILKVNIQDGARQNITIKNEKITVLSDSIALLTASGDAMININPNQAFTSKFLWSFVFEKIDNEWKVVHSHQSKAN